MSTRIFIVFLKSLLLACALLACAVPGSQAALICSPNCPVTPPAPPAPPSFDSSLANSDHIGTLFNGVMSGAIFGTEDTPRLDLSDVFGDRVYKDSIALIDSSSPNPEIAFWSKYISHLISAYQLWQRGIVPPDYPNTPTDTTGYGKWSDIVSNTYYPGRNDFDSGGGALIYLLQQSFKELCGAWKLYDAAVLLQHPNAYNGGRKYRSALPRKKPRAIFQEAKHLRIAAPSQKRFDYREIRHL